MLADGSSKKSVCERFGISNDVLYRIQAENNICGKFDESNRFTLSDEKQAVLYVSFENTDLTLLIDFSLLSIGSYFMCGGNYL